MDIRHDYSQRLNGVRNCLEDFGLVGDQEFFEDPKNRVDFLLSLEPDEFIAISNQVNARVRGRTLREQSVLAERGGRLKTMPTPKTAKDRLDALRLGFQEVKTALSDPQIPVADKVDGASMALEALVVWAHPFEDGNGRVSRFWAKFMSSGTTDLDSFVEVVADNSHWQRFYGPELRGVQNGSAHDMLSPFAIANSVGRLAVDENFQLQVKKQQRKFLANSNTKTSSKTFGIGQLD